MSYKSRKKPLTGPILTTDGRLDFNAMITLNRKESYAYVFEIKKKEFPDDLLKLAQVTDFTFHNEANSKPNVSPIGMTYPSVSEFLKICGYEPGEYLVPWFVLFHKYLEFYNLQNTYNSEKDSHKEYFHRNYPFKRYKYVSKYLRKYFTTFRMSFYKLNIDLNCNLEDTVALHNKYKTNKRSKWQIEKDQQKKEAKRKRKELLKTP